MKKKTFRIPKHCQCLCHLVEDRDSIKLISYFTLVATFDKHFHAITVHGRYNATTDRHIQYFREYLHDRYQLCIIPCVIEFVSTKGHYYKYC